MKRPTGVVERFNKTFTRPLAQALARYPWLSPNMLTWTSLVVGVFAGGLIYYGVYRLSGVLVLFSAWLDSLDGDLARARGRTSPRGAILDAVLDRYIDFAILAGLTLNTGAYITGGLAIFGALMVPYVRAKTEAEGLSSTATFASRDIRNLLLFVGLVFQRPYETLLVLAVLTNLSAIHRFYHSQTKGETP